MTIEIRIMLGNIILYLFAQVADDKNEICDPCLMQLIDGDTKYGFSR